MVEAAPEDTERGNLASRCLATRKRLLGKREGGGWTPACDARVKDVLAKLS
jgi:hypothetical protein